MEVDHLGNLRIIWELLHTAREDCIPEGKEERYDDQWSDVCTAMAQTAEELGIDQKEI